MTDNDWKILDAHGVTPDNLSVGGGLDLEGTGITSLLNDERGYCLDRVGGRYIAGCQNFSAEEAMAHWSSKNYPDLERGFLFCDAVRKEEMARAKAANPTLNKETTQ